MSFITCVGVPWGFVGRNPKAIKHSEAVLELRVGCLGFAGTPRWSHVISGKKKDSKGALNGSAKAKKNGIKIAGCDT